MAKSVNNPEFIIGKSKAPINIGSEDTFGKSGFEYNKYDVGLNASDYKDRMKIRQARQGIGEAVANSIGQVLTTVAGQTIQGIDAMTLGGLEALTSTFTGEPTDFSSGIGDMGRALEDWGRSEMPIWVDEESGFGSLNYMLSNAPNVASTLSMLVPQMGAARIIGGIGKALRASQVAMNLAQVGGGALVGRHIENSMEASRVFEDVYKKSLEFGMNDAEARVNASEAASIDYKMNYANLIFDVVQLGSILKPMKAAPKIGANGSRFNAVTKLDYEVANARAKDFGRKGIMDGANIYEKTAIQGYRYLGAPLAQVTEGIEEFWNTTSQRESTRKAMLEALEASDLKYTDPEAYEAEKKAYDADTTFMERIDKYTGEKEFKDSFIWGWIGGTMYSALGKPVAKAMNAIKGNEPQLYGSIKAQDFAQRGELIKKHLNVINNPKADEVDLIRSQNENIFGLAESALRAGNMDVLLEDLQDDDYLAVIAKNNNIDIETAKKNVAELRTTLEQIANDYNGFVGYNFDGYKGFQDYVNVQPYGEMTGPAYDFGQRIEPEVPMRYTIKEIAGKLKDGETVRIDLALKNENNEDVQNYVIAKKQGDKLIVNGEDFAFSEREIVDARKAKEVKDAEAFEVKRKGLFGFVDPNVGMYLTRLSFFSRESEKAAKKAGLEATKILSEKYGNANPMIVAFGDMIMKRQLSINRASKIKSQLGIAKSSKVSEETIEELEQDLKEAEDRAALLQDQINGQMEMIKDLTTSDFQISNGMAFAGYDSNELAKTMNELSTDLDLFKLYQQGEDANMVKKKFARERQRIIKDPVNFYKRLIEDNSKMSEYEEAVKKDKDVYNIDELDSEEVKTIKRQMVDLFKAEPNAKDKGFDAELHALYKSEKEKYAAQYAANPVTDKTRQDDLTKLLAEMKKKIGTEEFDMRKYIDARAELDALNEVAAKSKVKEQAAKIKIERTEEEETDDDIEANNKKFIEAGTVFFDTIAELLDPISSKDPSDYSFAEQQIAARLIDPYQKIKRFYQLIGKDTMTPEEEKEYKELINDLDNPSYPFNLEDFLNNPPTVWAKVINHMNNTENTMAYGLEYVNAFKAAISQAAQEFAPIGGYIDAKTGKNYTIEEVEKKKLNKEDLDEFYASWDPKSAVEGKDIFDFIGFLEKAMPEAKKIFLAKSVELQNQKAEDKSKESEQPVHTIVPPASSEEVASGKASSEDFEPKGGVEGVTIVHNHNAGINNQSDPPIKITSGTGDQFVDVFTGFKLTYQFDAEGKPLPNPSVRVNDGFEFAIMNPDRAGSIALQAGDIVEVQKAINEKGELYFPVFKVGKDGRLYPIGTISDSRKNNNPKAIAAEQAFAKLFENTESTVNSGKLKEIERRRQESLNQQSEEEWNNEKGWFISDELDGTKGYAGYYNGEEVTAKTKEELFKILNAKYQAEIDALNVQTTEEINAIRFQLDARSVGIGELIQTKKLTSDPNSLKAALPLFEITDLDAINNKDRSDSLHLGVFDGNIIGERDNGLKPIIVPNGVVKGKALSPDLSGQVVALVPTNTVYSSMHNPQDAGKQAYIKAVLHTSDLGSLRVNGMSMPTLVLQKLADPVNNIDFVKAVAQMVGVNFGDTVNLEGIRALYTEQNMVKIFGNLMFLKGALKGDGVASRNYRYPINIDVKVDSKKGTVDLQIAHIMEGGEKNRLDIPVILPGSGINEEALKKVTQQKLQIFDDTYLKNKPFAIDARLINGTVGSGPYTGFGIANNEIVVKTYSSYLHYLNENRILTGTFMSVPLPGQNRRTFFQKPTITLNFERANMSEDGIMRGPAKTKTPEDNGLIRDTTPKTITPTAASDESINRLQTVVLKTAVLKEDESVYLAENEEYDRVHTVMGSTIPESELLDKAKLFGNQGDLAIREFLNTGSINYDNYPALKGFEIAFDQGAKSFKAHLDRNGQTVIPGETTIYGTLYDKDGQPRRVAGATDIVTINQKNEITVYDTKTMRGKVTSDGVASRMNDWIEQLNYYRELFKSQGYTVSKMNILPIGIDYGSFNDKIVGLDFTGRIIEVPVDDNLQYKSDREDRPTAIDLSVSTTETAGKAPSQAVTAEDIYKELESAAFDMFSNKKKDKSKNSISDMLNLDGDKNLYAVLNDETLDPLVSNSIKNLVSSVIIDVLFDQTVIKRNGDLNVETSLKPKVRAMLQAQLEYFVNQAAIAKNEGLTERYGNMITYAKFRQEALKRFDPADYTPEYAEMLGDFGGYFRAAYIGVSTNKLVQNSIRSAEIEDFDADFVDVENDQADKAPNRIQDEYYTKINPKDTVSFQTKLFLSRITVKDPNGNVQMTPAGVAMYYTLDEMLQRVISYMDIFGPESFSENSNSLYNIAEAQNDYAMQDLLAELNRLDDLYDSQNPNIAWPYTKSQMLKKLANASLKHNRNTKIIFMNYQKLSDTNLVGGMNTKVVDSNRQNLQYQIQQLWDTNFKEILDEFYVVGSVTENAAELPVNRIKELKAIEFNRYKTIKNDGDVANVTLPVLEGENTSRVAMRLVYEQIVNLRNLAENNPSKKYYLAFPEGDAFDIKDAKGNITGSLSIEDFKTALYLVTLPENVYVPQALAEGMESKSIIGNLAVGVKRLLSMGDGNGYSMDIYYLLSEQLNRLGINLSEMEGMAGLTLATLENSISREKSVYHKLDPKARSVRQFLSETLLDNLINKLSDATAMYAIDLDNPLVGISLGLEKLSRLSKPGFPSLINPNSTSIFGENEYTAVSHTYLSYKTKQLKNNDAVRAFYLNDNQLTANSLHIKELFAPTATDDKKAFEVFDVHDIRGINFNNRNKVSNKTLNETQRAILDYNIFQNGENVDNKGRGVGYFTTTHGESTTIPALSMMKQNVDYIFQVDENQKVSLMLKRQDSRFYDLLFSQFKGEMYAVVEAEKIFRKIKQVEESKGFEAAVEFAKQNYINEKHYNIKGNQILPGNRTKFYMFGAEMFNDTRGLIYNKDGRLNDMFNPFFLDADAGELREAIRKIEDGIFFKYANEFLNSLVDNEIQRLSETEGEWFKKEDIIMGKFDPDSPISNRVVGLKFPLFDNGYAYKMSKRLLYGGIDANDTTQPMTIMIKGIHEKPVPTSQLRSDFELRNEESKIYSDARKEEIIEENKKIRENTLFGELQKHYMVADFVLNYLLFYNTYDSLYADHTSFSKSGDYFALMEERNKRDKTLMGPGAMTAGNQEFDVQNSENTNLVYAHVIEDIKPVDLQVDMLRADLQGNMKYNDFLSWVQKLPSDRLGKAIKAGFNFEEKVVGVPANLDELASMYVVNKNTMANEDLKSSIQALMYQEMTDGGAIIDLREQIARYVRNGDIDQKKAPMLYKVLSNPELTYEQFEKAMKDFNLNRNTFQISKNIYSGTTKSQYNTIDGKANVDEFHILKNSEIVMIPAFAKGSPWEGALQDADRSLKNFLESKGINPNSPEAFQFGNILAFKSNVKSNSRFSTKAFGKNGKYIPGSVGSSKALILSREHFRNQGGKNVKEEMLTTASSQLQQMSLLGIDSQADFSTNNSYGLKLNEKISGSRLAKMRYDLEGQFTTREMIKIFNRMGVKLVRENGKDKPVIEDFAAFVKAMSDQVVNQQGIGLHLEAFKLTVEKDNPSVLRAPLSYTPFNIIAQNVLLNQFNKAIQRKISGISLIQATSFGLFNKENIKVDNNLKGGRVDIVDSGRTFFTHAEISSTFSKDDIYKIESFKDPQGVEKYRVYVYKVQPAEIAMGWNLRDANGELLNYEDYVDPVTMRPLPNKIDDSLLYGISYRTPNTPHNTTSYTKVVKFLPPMYKDVVLVSPQMMTAMSSDLDVDVLNVLFYEYQQDESGKLNRIKSVLSTSQDTAAILNSTTNKEEVFKRLLMSDYEYSKLKKQYDKKLSVFLRQQGDIIDILNNEELDKDVKIDLLKAKGLEATELKSLLDTFTELAAQDPATQLNNIELLIEEGDLQETFFSEYADILENNPDLTEEEAYDELKKYVNGLKKEYRKQAKKYRKENLDDVLDRLNEQIQAEIENLKDAVTDASPSLVQLESQMTQAENRIRRGFETKYSNMSVFDKQNDKQLNNAVIDTFILQYSSPTGYRLSSQPLNTNLLKEMVEGENLSWQNADGTVSKISFDEAINNKGFRALNSVTTRRKSKAAAQDNGAMVGVFANSLRLLQYASANGFFVNSTDALRKGIKYAYSKRLPNGLMVTETEMINGSPVPKIKKEDGVENGQLTSLASDTSIHNPGYITYGWDNPAIKGNGMPDTSTRYRLDSVYHINNAGDRSYSFKVLLQSLQAVLDGVKDPIASKMGLNMNNVNAYIAHVMLGYSDEIVPLFRQPAIVKYIKEVVENTVEKEPVTEMAIIGFIDEYIKNNGVTGLAKLKEGVVPDNAIQYLEFLLSEQGIVQSEATLKSDIVLAYNLDNQNRTMGNDFHKRQLMALLNYIKADAIGENLTTVAITLNPYAKGVPGTILELEEKMNKYKDLNKYSFVNGEGTITSTAPLIGNLSNISTGRFKRGHYNDNVFRPGFVGVEHTMDNVVEPILNMLMGLTENNVFTELSPINRLVYQKMSTRMKLKRRMTAKQKMDVALAFESYMFSNPQIYRSLFDNEAEFEILKDFGIEALVLRNNKINPELTKRLKAIENKTVFISDNSLAEFADKVKNMKDDRGVPKKNIYKLLGAIKELKNNNAQGNADYILYMNIADFKNGFNSDYMLTINQMLESGDKDMEALAKQLIIYTFISGGISSPNSFIKFISQGVNKDRFATLTNYLNNLNYYAAREMKKVKTKLNTTTQEMEDSDVVEDEVGGLIEEISNENLSDIISSFAIQYFQHNPTKAPMLKADYKVGRIIEEVTEVDGKEVIEKKFVTRYYDKDINRVIIPVRNAPGDLAYYGKTPVIKEIDENGVTHLYMFQKSKAGNQYVSIDNAGNSRYNFREYKYSESKEAISSVISRNVRGGKRGMIIRQLAEEQDNLGPKDAAAFSEQMTSSELNAYKYSIYINEESSPYYSFINATHRKYAKYVVSNNLYGVRIVPTENTDRWTFGEYDSKTDIIRLNADFVKEQGVSNPDRVTETINHELTHAAIDRAFTSWVNPKATVQMADGTMAPFLDKNQRELMNQPMMMLNAVIKFSAQALNDKKGQYHKQLKNLVDRYKAAQKEGDVGLMKDLAFVPAVIQRIEQFVKLYGVEAFNDPTNMPLRTAEAYTEIGKEFISYFMTNYEFQQLLNQVELDSGKKSLWRQLVDAFLEILDALTGGKGLRKFTSTEAAIMPEIQERTLAHATAIASFDLINATGTLRYEEDTTEVSNSRLRDIKADDINDTLINLAEAKGDKLIVVYGSKSGAGPYSQYDDKDSVYIVPLRKTDGDGDESFYTKADVPVINKMFDQLTSLASDVDYTYVVEDILSNSIADYKNRDKAVYNAFKKGFENLRKALDKKASSKNRIDLLTDLLDFKFDQAEIEEVSAYKKCK